MLHLLLACEVPAAPPPPPHLAVPAPAPVPADPIPTTGAFSRELAPGLVFAGYLPPPIPDDGFSRPPPDAVAGTDRRIYVVTVDPARFAIDLYSALDPTRGSPERTGPGWAAAFDLQVAFNPGMFEPDGRATGHTRAWAFTAQPQVRGQALYRAWFVADPLAGGPALAVLDAVPPPGAGGYAPLEALAAPFRQRLEGHGLVAQSLAIVRDGRAVYPPRKNQWSELAYGVDRDGRLVVVFSRFPYEMRELGRRLEALGIGVDGLLHGEGGPEATLVVRAGGLEWVGVGSYETGFWDDSNARAWALPAVMGVRPR